MPRRPIIDWVEVKKTYITNQDMTYQEVADMFGISLSTLKIKAQKEKWVEERKKHFEKILKKSCDKIANKMANSIAKTAENLINGMEKASEELHTHEEFNMFGKLVKKQTETVRVGKLTSLVKSLTLMQKIELEKEKLEIEKAKLGNNSNNEDKVLEYMKVLKEELDEAKES